MTKPLVYISGPYAKPCPVVNARVAVACWKRLLGTGLVTPIVPHVSLLMDLIAPMTHSEWLAYDLEILARSDAILRLSGESPGADREVERARELGLPVFDDEQALYAWVPTRVGKPMFIEMNGKIREGGAHLSSDQEIEHEKALASSTLFELLDAMWRETRHGPRTVVVGGCACGASRLGGSFLGCVFCVDDELKRRGIDLAMADPSMYGRDKSMRIYRREQKR